MSQPNPILSKWSSPTVCEMALHDFNRLHQERVRQGEISYGIKLATFAYRSAVRDAKEEVVDTYNYLEQIEMEQIALRNMFWALESYINSFQYHHAAYLSSPDVWERWFPIRETVTDIAGMLYAQEPRQEKDAVEIDAGVASSEGGGPDELS